MNISRPRRNRKHASIRRLVEETKLSFDDLVMPVFIEDGHGISFEISTMPGINRYSPDLLSNFCEKLLESNVNAIALFPLIKHELKDRLASYSTDQSNYYLKTIADIKKQFPELIIISDVAMDPYNSDGHDGIVDEDGRVLNDESLLILGKMAVAQAQAGVDIVAPSDMMDGRVAFIREALDQAGFFETSILSYTAKYASAFYGPFRDALDSAPAFGDKKTYQMNPANSNEAILEADLDIAEGADMIMVKPGLPYLDIVRTLKNRYNKPVAVYNVSGEYAALKFASLNGALDYKKCVLEVLLSMKRSGADFILTYHALEAAQWLKGEVL